MSENYLACKDPISFILKWNLTLNLVGNLASLYSQRSPRNVPIASFTDDMGPKGVVMVIKPQGSLAKNGEKYWYWTSQILKVPQVFPSLGNFCCYFLQFRVYNFLIFLSLSEPCPGGIFQQLFSIVEDNGTSWRENKRIPLSNKFGELWFKCNRISFNSRLVGVFGTPIYVVNF